MKNWKKLICAAALFAAGSLFAAQQDYDWTKPIRINSGYWISLGGIDANHRMAIEPVYSGELKPQGCKLRQTGAEDTRAFGLGVEVPADKTKWNCATFSFKVRSRRKGKVRLTIHPHGNGGRRIPGTEDDWYDLPYRGFMGVGEISSKDVKFPNRGFFTAPGQAKQWGINVPKDPNQKPKILRDEPESVLPSPGRSYLRTCQPINVTFDVVPEKVITINLKLKPMEVYEPLH